MDTLLLGITVVSLGIALVMSVTAWRLMRDEKRRSAARIAALSAAASTDAQVSQFPELPLVEPKGERITRAPWKPATPIVPELQPEPAVIHATGFLGAASVERDNGGRQRGLAIAA